MCSGISWNDVCKELSTISGKWFNFGVNLGVPQNKLKQFGKKEDPLSEVIGYWHKGNIRDKPVTWESITATLRITEEPGLADKIKAKYCDKETSGYYYISLSGTHRS